MEVIKEAPAIFLSFIYKIILLPIFVSSFIFFRSCPHEPNSLPVCGDVLHHAALLRHQLARRHRPRDEPEEGRVVAAEFFHHIPPCDKSGARFG